MKNEDNKKYPDERKSLDENSSPNLDPENEIKSRPKKELLDSSNDAEELKNESNDVLDMMKKKKGKDLTIPIILGVVFLIIVTVIGLYLLKDKDISLIGEKNYQQKILNSSMIAMSDIDSYSFGGDLNVDLATGEDEEGFSLAMKFDGQADGGDTDNTKSSFNVKPEIAISTEGGNEDVSFDFSMRSFGKIGEEMIYLKLNDFDLGATGLIYGEMIVPYKNKWYFLDMKKLKEESSFPLEENDFDVKKIAEEIKDLSKKYEMIKFRKDLGDTKLNDADVYHYQVKIDSEAAFDFYVELLKTIVPKINPTANFEDFDAEIEENQEEILAVANEVLANVKTEIWIGKEDKMIYKIAMSGKFDEEFMERLEREIHNGFYDEIEVEENNINNTNAELSFDMSITMSDFNQPISISKPEKSEDLMKVLEEAMAGVMGGMMLPEPATGLKGDLDQDELTIEQEAFYGTDPNNPDTDGDGHSDGDEVSKGYDPLLPGEAKLDYDKLFNN